MGQKRLNKSEDGGSKHPAERKFTQHPAKITNEAVTHALSKCFIHSPWPGQTVVSDSGLAHCLMECGACVDALFLIHSFLRVLPHTGWIGSVSRLWESAEQCAYSLLWIMVMETRVSWLSNHTDSARVDLAELIRSQLLCVRSICW